MARWTKLFLFSTLLHFSITAFSQVGEIGLKGGYTLNRFYYRAQFNAYQENSSGFLGGVAYQYRLPGPVHFSTGLYFQKTGSRVNDLELTDNLGNTVARGDYKHDLNYITLPLLGHFSFGSDGIFSLGAGVFGSYLLSAKGKLLKPQFNTGFEENLDLTRDHHRFNFGLAGAASVRFRLRKSLFLDLAFEEYLGMKHISRISGQKGKTNSYGLSASLLTRLK